MTPKNLFIKSGNFFKKESTKIVNKLANAKDEKSFEQASKELAAIRRRITIEIDLLDKFCKESD